MAASPSIEEDLETLLTAIKNLPASAQSGHRSAPLGKYLTPGLTKSNNPEPTFPSHKDGAYFVFNHQWEHVFQKQPGDPDDKLQKLVSSGRGMHGLILAHAWANDRPRWRCAAIVFDVKMHFGECLLQEQRPGKDAEQKPICRMTHLSIAGPDAIAGGYSFGTSRLPRVYEEWEGRLAAQLPALSLFFPSSAGGGGVKMQCSPCPRGVQRLQQP
ncbi:hypothetical protein B0H14DRAFT_2602686 [Mycena olivaceomarginata]|nr:hypothetical protein B0H14DRAFT_2602686 [Mycena olivaceomarginata]